MCGVLGAIVAPLDHRADRDRAADRRGRLELRAAAGAAGLLEQPGRRRRSPSPSACSSTRPATPASAPTGSRSPRPSCSAGCSRPSQFVSMSTMPLAPVLAGAAARPASAAARRSPCSACSARRRRADPDAVARTVRSVPRPAAWAAARGASSGAGRRLRQPTSGPGAADMAAWIPDQLRSPARSLETAARRSATSLPRSRPSRRARRVQPGRRARSSRPAPRSMDQLERRSRRRDRQRRAELVVDRLDQPPLGSGRPRSPSSRLGGDVLRRSVPTAPGLRTSSRRPRSRSAAALTRTASEACDPAGRPLYAAHADLDCAGRAAPRPRTGSPCCGNTAGTAHRRAAVRRADRPRGAGDTPRRDRLRTARRTAHCSVGLMRVSGPVAARRRPGRRRWRPWPRTVRLRARSRVGHRRDVASSALPPARRDRYRSAQGIGRPQVRRPSTQALTPAACSSERYLAVPTCEALAGAGDQRRPAPAAARR